MKHIKNCIPNIHSASTSSKQWKLKLMTQWGSIIGNLQTKVSIYKIYNDSIVLGVSDSSWMNELYLLSEVIKKKINATLDTTHIENIRFKYVTEKKKSKQKAITTVSEKLPDKPLSSREKKALEKIQDPDLAQLLTRLLQKCHQ